MTRWVLVRLVLIDGNTAEDLIEAADSALYRSKLVGKNAVTLAVVLGAQEPPDIS